MDLTEHLLTILAEESCEVGHRSTKALRFGMNERQVGEPLTNAERIMYEVYDLLAVMELLQREEQLPVFSKKLIHELMLKKKQKVERYLCYSRSCGTLNESPLPQTREG